MERAEPFPRLRPPVLPKLFTAAVPDGFMSRSNHSIIKIDKTTLPGIPRGLKGRIKMKDFQIGVMLDSFRLPVRDAIEKARALGAGRGADLRDQGRDGAGEPDPHRPAGTAPEDPGRRDAGLGPLRRFGDGVWRQGEKPRADRAVQADPRPGAATWRPTSSRPTSASCRRT